MAVEFTHFQAQFDEVSVDGIDLTVLNNAVACVKPITVHSLWMHNWRAITDKFTLFTFDLSQTPFQDFTHNFSVPCTKTGELHAIVMWLDYHFSNHIIVSNQPFEGISRPSWKKQMVWMFSAPFPCVAHLDDDPYIQVDCTHDGYDSSLKFNFTF
eukprot:TRINITY_DN3691_c0_g2_i28.p1 TRINITY_DN3691_c0_g2~~TRINITY_DN3691_c0_g2_i28.p1  ORF type:complete len:155 (-),score=19.74 TRINITY_DN3691_c0_g2_i28:80-544(-)